MWLYEGELWRSNISQPKIYVKTESTNIVERMDPKGNCSGSVFVPACDVWIWAIRVLPVGPFDWQPPGGSGNLTTKWQLSTFLLLLTSPPCVLHLVFCNTQTHPTGLIYSRLVSRTAEMLMVSSNTPLMGPQQPYDEAVDDVWEEPVRCRVSGFCLREAHCAQGCYNQSGNVVNTLQAVWQHWSLQAGTGAAAFMEAYCTYATLFGNLKWQFA